MALVVRPLWAHDGQPVAPHDLATAWNFSPPLLISLGAAGWFYGRCLAGRWRHGTRAGNHGLRRQAAFFYSGLLTLGIALISPLDGVSSGLLTAHMVQHLLLIVVAAPLLVWGAPPTLWLWAWPLRTRRQIGRWWQRQHRLRPWWQGLAHPITAWVLHGVTIWLWHVPAIYQQALQVEWLHALEHSLFLATALLFWWAVAHSTPGVSTALLFTTALHSGLLGALLTFARTPLYPLNQGGAPLWGLTPLADQHLAGVIMWGPMGLIYLSMTLVRLAHLLDEPSSGARVPTDANAEVRCDAGQA
jgi:putative membrane protein